MLGCRVQESDHNATSGLTRGGIPDAKTFDRTSFDGDELLGGFALERFSNGSKISRILFHLHRHRPTGH